MCEVAPSRPVLWCHRAAIAKLAGREKSEHPLEPNGAPDERALPMDKSQGCKSDFLEMLSDEVDLEERCWDQRAIKNGVGVSIFPFSIS